MQSTEATRALAQRVLDFIHEHPEHHDQGSIDMNGPQCGTTMCIAGTAAWLTWGDKSGDIIYTGTGAPVGLIKVGSLLGLSHNEAEDLFFNTSDNEKAVQKLKHIIVGEPFELNVDLY